MIETKSVKYKSECTFLKNKSATVFSLISAGINFIVLFLNFEIAALKSGVELISKEGK